MVFCHPQNFSANVAGKLARRIVDTQRVKHTGTEHVIQEGGEDNHPTPAAFCPRHLGARAGARGGGGGGGRGEKRIREKKKRRRSERKDEEKKEEEKEEEEEVVEKRGGREEEEKVEEREENEEDEKVKKGGRAGGEGNTFACILSLSP
ncbi:hypothetical protein PoB_007340500 [Plakobranchus ocellatus]|uniref:Uncharacterized protein n=1 Tax=Plakobranchus ocellatus TaxID=259542 RepID=A0AAV4DRX2_9GAST|nr:hypothetical protein PoB_007340500 [Plakobranchus ocellatus]